MENKRSNELVSYRNYEHMLYDKESDKYIHYVPVSYGELLGKKLEEHYSVDFNDLEDLYLSNATPSIPTELNGLGYVNVDNYILDFWGHIISPLELQVLLTLIRWSFRKGFTTISITELSERLGKGRTAVRNAIDVLEDNFFLIKIQRRYKESEKGGSPDSGVFIRLRGTTPMLSQEQVKTLPQFLQDEHEEIVEKVNRSKLDAIDYRIKPFQKTFMRSFIIDKCVSEDKVDKDISFLIKKHGIKELANLLVSIDYELDTLIKSELEKLVSKPSFDVFILNTVFYLENDGEVLTALCQDEYVAERLDNGILKSSIESVFEKIQSKTGIRVAGFNSFGFAKYYKILYNRKLF